MARRRRWCKWPACHQKMRKVELLADSRVVHTHFAMILGMESRLQVNRVSTEAGDDSARTAAPERLEEYKYVWPPSPALSSYYRADAFPHTAQDLHGTFYLLATPSTISTSIKEIQTSTCLHNAPAGSHATARPLRRSTPRPHAPAPRATTSRRPCRSSWSPGDPAWRLPSGAKQMRTPSRSAAWTLARRRRTLSGLPRARNL